MTRDQDAVCSNGIRWASNILVELAGNYGRHMSEAQRDSLKRATAALNEYRSEMPPEEDPPPHPLPGKRGLNIHPKDPQR